MQLDSENNIVYTAEEKWENKMWRWFFVSLIGSGIVLGLIPIYLGIFQ
jgi:hypothetical protein